MSGNAIKLITSVSKIAMTNLEKEIQTHLAGNLSMGMLITCLPNCNKLNVHFYACIELQC